MHYGLRIEIGNYSFDKHWHSDFDITRCPPWDISDPKLNTAGIFTPPPRPGALGTKVGKGSIRLKFMSSRRASNYSFCMEWGALEESMNLRMARRWSYIGNGTGSCSRVSDCSRIVLCATYTAVVSAQRALSTQSWSAMVRMLQMDQSLLPAGCTCSDALSDVKARSATSVHVPLLSSMTISHLSMSAHSHGLALRVHFATPPPIFVCGIQTYSLMVLSLTGSAVVCNLTRHKRPMNSCDSLYYIVCTCMRLLHLVSVLHPKPPSSGGAYRWCLHASVSEEGGWGVGLHLKPHQLERVWLFQA